MEYEKGSVEGPRAVSATRAWESSRAAPRARTFHIEMSCISIRRLIEQPISKVPPRAFGSIHHGERYVRVGSRPGSGVAPTLQLRVITTPFAHSECQRESPGAAHTLLWTV